MNYIKPEDLNEEIDNFIKDLCRAGVKSEVRERLSNLLQAYKNLDIPMGISAWKNHGIKWHYWYFFKDEDIVKFRKESRKD